MVLQKNNLLNEEDGSLVETVNEVAKENPNELERFQNGEDKLKGFFMGQVMRKTQGKANPNELNKLIEGLKKHTH